LLFVLLPFVGYRGEADVNPTTLLLLALGAMLLRRKKY
jgi:hypothetical protein